MVSKIDKSNLGYLGSDYQVRLIAQMLTDIKFARNIIDIINPNYFKDEYHRLIVSEIKNAKETNDVIPNISTIKFRLLNNVSDEYTRKLLSKELDKIEQADSHDFNWVQETAMKFCKKQELKKALKDIDKIIDKDDDNTYHECENILKKALEHGNGKDESIDVLYDIESVLSDDYRDPVRTGISGLDEIMDGGLGKGELALILAPFGVGKAQPLFSKILTPNGWATMGDIKIGDYVIGRDGKPTKVVGVFPQGKRPIFTVKFNDGTKTLCDAEHLWSVNTINQRNRKTKKDGKVVYLEPDNSFKVMKTIDMIDNVKVWGNRRLNYKIPNVSPVEFNKKDLIIDPYLLGVILGDGCVTYNNQPHFVTKDYEIIDEVRKVYENISIIEQNRNVEKNVGGKSVLVNRSLTKVSLLGIKKSLLELDLYGKNSSTKFIPKDYIYTSISDRISLLQGLVDTDGYINDHIIEISTASKQLSLDIKELILSLGGRVSISERIGKYNNIECKLSYRITFSFPDNGIKPSRLTRKLINYKHRTKYSNNKFIESIEYFGEEEAKCIMVENSEHLYVTDDYIVTHNTTMITKIANTAWLDGKNVLQIFFEDTVKNIQRKHLSCMTGIELNSLNIRREEVLKIRDEVLSRPNIGKLKLRRFPSDGVTIPMIKNYVYKLISDGFKPDIILLDYIDVVVPSKKYDDANVGEGSVMRQFESMLAELDIPGWSASQGNRESIKAAIVESNQMGGSIKKGQIVHFLCSIAKTLEQKDNGTATMAVLKSRFGKSGVVFEDIVFDNATIQVDMGKNNVVKTQVQYMEGTQAAKVSRVAELMNRKKALNEE